jgi:tRNA pseudouridine38-40 synthase
LNIEEQMTKYAILLSYAGTDFWGWQTQKGEDALNSKPNIQTTIEKALSQMTGETARVVGSGRTDSGVHALGQVAHFILKKREWKENILCRGLNGILPMSIRVLAAQKVPLEFHAQKSALKKQYSFYFQQGPCPLPHLLPYTWWIHKKLDLKAMADALRYLEGEKDYKPFQASGAKPGPTVRKIFETEVCFQPISFPFTQELGDPLGLVRVRILGSGFLKQMVRGIAGTLLQVGEGRRPSSDFKKILETADRGSVGPTAPARALWLEQVWYSESYGLWNLRGGSDSNGSE